MSNKSLVSLLVVIVVVVVAFYGGFWYGNKEGEKSGYDRGLTDAARIQSAAESEVQIDTGYKNPYEGVNFNPFQ
jgi:hypothetical protein